MSTDNCFNCLKYLRFSSGFSTNGLFGRDYSFKYKDSDNNVFDGLSFEINNGDRVVIDGENGSGKSSLIKAILDMNRGIVKENANYEGEGILEVPENLAQHIAPHFLSKL